jgi:hypothetical protein
VRFCIASTETPNYVSGNEEIPGLATRRWVDERAQEWGESSHFYLARVMGEFPPVGLDALMAREAIEAATWLRVEPSGVPVLGCDVARFGDDQTVIVVRHGGVLREVIARRRQDTMATVGLVVDAARRHCVAARDIKVDDCGLGGGVVDRLREMGLAVSGVNGGAAADAPHVFANVRAETWRRMADAVQQGRLSLAGAPGELLDDLAAPRYAFTSLGQQRLEDKADTKQRLGRSPDYGDALALTFADGRREPRTWVF